MDDRRFDALVRELGKQRSRRGALKALLGIGSVASVGAIVLDDVQAARRGEPLRTPTPRPTAPPAPPTSTSAPPTQIPPSATAACPGVMCNGGCCDGQCTSTGACCPAGSTVCGPDCCPNGQAECCDNACCYGVCYGEELCCPTGRIACNGMCLPVGGCCTDAECPGARCLQHVCVAFTPTDTPQPTVTPTATPRCREAADCGVCTCRNGGRDIACPVCSAGNCEVVTTLCPEGTSCVDGECQAFTPTSASTATATPPATETSTATATPTATSTESATPTATATPSHTPLPARVEVAITPACFPQAIVSGFPPNYSIPEVRFLAKRADGTEFSLGTYAHQFTTDGDGNVIATGTAPIVNSAAQVRATASIGSEVYTSGFIVKTCSVTPTPSHTPTGTATATSSPAVTRTATTAAPSITAFLLDRIIECHVVVELSGFPPNGPVTLSMIAFEDDIFAGFPSGNFFFEDVAVGPDGTLQYAMGPVWLDRDFGVTVTVRPFATSPTIGEVWSLDPVVLPESCNPND